MGLYERLTNLEEPKLSIHAFVGCAAEWVRGRMNANQAKAALGLSAAEGNEALTLVNRVTSGALSREEVQDVLLMAEQQTFYATVAAIKARLGV